MVSSSTQTAAHKITAEPKLAKKTYSVLVAIEKIKQMFDKLKKHESYNLFNEPFDPDHCLFESLKHRFTTLYLIELKFRTGVKYHNSN